jgi:hypothetical protein
LVGLGHSTGYRHLCHCVILPSFGDGDGVTLMTPF